MMRNHVLLTAHIGLAFSLMVAAPALATDGHCNYRQFSPKINRAFPVCQMPASPKDCEALVSRYKSRVEYGEGSCPERAVGACQIGTGQMFFYAGSAEELARGCEIIKGMWTAGLQPGQHR